jgi:DNA mismatch repair protein MSH6
MIHIINGSHPCLTQLGINYVPNTVKIGGENPGFLLVTGPNMGGKSTTLRMVCILIVLAQVGCFVPCESMEFTPVDRIFTRIGAQDLLMEGKSTFYLELEEILNPLNLATKSSLCIVDELGRGTSTYDGVAIAHAVMKYLATGIRCCTLFSTHFRILVEEARMIENVGNFFMVNCDEFIF